jgi:nucleoside-diphosphate-sugar epimerase
VTLLVTGATGYIGRRVALRLIGAGRPIRLLCRDPRRLDPQLAKSSLVQVLIGDVSDDRAVRRACEGVTAIVHLAAAMSGPAEDFDRSTIRGTKAILAAAAAEGVDRLVYVSSMSVYDYATLPRGTVVNEEAPLESHPELRDNYARSKRVAEALVTEHMPLRGPSAVIVRPGIVYGPGGRDPLTPVTSLRHVGRGIFALVGGGRRQVPLIYVENLVDALVLLLDSQAAGGRIYNVIDADPPSEREYLDRVRRVTGARIRTVPIPTWTIMPLALAAEWMRRLRGRGGMDIVHGLQRVTGEIRFDTGKLQREMGWTSTVDLTSGMATSFGGGPEDARTDRVATIASQTGR